MGVWIYLVERHLNIVWSSLIYCTFFFLPVNVVDNYFSCCQAQIGESDTLNRHQDKYKVTHKHTQEDQPPQPHSRTNALQPSRTADIKLCLTDRVLPGQTRSVKHGWVGIKGKHRTDCCHFAQHDAVCCSWQGKTHTLQRETEQVPPFMPLQRSKERNPFDIYARDTFKLLF